MKALILNHEFPPIGGGAGTACFHTCRELNRLGVSVSVITSAYKDQPRFEVLDGVSIYRVPALRQKTLESTTTEIVSFLLSATVEAARFVRRENPDLIHAYFGLPSGAIGWALNKLLGVPYLISFRGRDVHGGSAKGTNGIQGPMRWLSRPVWRSADSLIANSDGLRDIALNVLPEAQIGVIPNGVNADEFSQGSAHSDRTAEALYVGRLESYKGLGDLLEAVRCARAAGADFRLSIVGDGSIHTELKTQATSLGVDDCVTFLGQIDRKRIPDHYRSADFLVLPSIVEGMPNTILEGMASGLPVLATQIPGSEELVDDRNGILVEPSCPEALADGLIALSADTELRKRLGKESRKKAMKRSWRSVAEAYLRVYRKLVTEERRCAA